MISDNAGLMLLSLLKKCGVQHVMLAGFDGFRHSYGENYYSEESGLWCRPAGSRGKTAQNEK